MKIIPWNVKGLGRQKKNTSIKDILRKVKPDIVMIQETEKVNLDRKCLFSFGEVETKIGSLFPSIDSARGMSTAWKTNPFEMKPHELGTFSSGEIKK